MTEGKDIVIIGGPNGAGKTTAARVLLSGRLTELEFLNADEIARALRPENPEAAALAAGRELIQRMRSSIQDGRSFALETTCAGRSYIPTFERCRQLGWTISFFYFWLPFAEDSIARVARRVAQGGHSIPSDVIHRRFRIGLWNMRHLYLPLAHTAAIYDNSGRSRLLIAEKELGFTLRIIDPERWSRIEELTQ